MLTVILNAFYDFGNTIGPIGNWFFGLGITAMVVYVMAKYLFSKK